ncbi:MAG: metallophosphoesterase family protein [Polyangiales bacterium]
MIYASLAQRWSLLFACTALVVACDAGPRTMTARDSSAAVDAADSASGASETDAGSSAPITPPRGPMQYVPAGCAHTVRSTPGAVSFRLGDESTLGRDPAPRAPHVTFAADPRSTAAVLWRTDDGTLASVVEYGRSPMQLDRRAVGHASRAGFGVPITMHETHLCGLEPDTTYYYRVGAPGAFSDVQSFKTAPADASGTVNFAFFGDSRDDFAVFRTVNEAVLRQPGMSLPDAVLFTGDAIPTGLVQDDWDRWFDAATPTMRAMPYILAHGNHEGLAANYLHQFAQPQSDDRNRSELYWSWDYGPVHLVVLNDSPFPIVEGIEGAQRAWLDADLARADANRANVPWVVVMHHKGPFSSALHTEDADVDIVRRAWVPLYAQHHVDLVVNGHDHHFELTYPLDWLGARAALDDYGVVYVTAGASGAFLYANPGRLWTRTIESTVNFGALRISRDRLRMEAFRVDMAGMPSPIAGSCVLRERDATGQRPVERPCP